MKRKFLIATSNPGKFSEMQAFLASLPFDFVGLPDLPAAPPPPEEIGPTLEDNALVKARYYAQKTGLTAIADDAGLFVEALGGWPGVKSARFAPTNEERLEIMRQKAAALIESERSALFRAAVAVVDPATGTSFVASGETQGTIIPEGRGTPRFGYESVFEVAALRKTYAELSLAEKNGVSHRGRALIKIKYHLSNTYGSKHIVVPYALIVKDGQVLMNRRNEPHRQEFHGKWEFPGGKVEFGETMHGNLKREVFEEVGYQVEIVKALQHIAVESQAYPTFSYQVFLVPYVCRVVGGEVKLSDSEVLETGWFDPDRALDYEMIGKNDSMYRQILPEFKEIIAAYNL
ncbi:MAG: Non-canonical purine NTP pyrophosphatase [Candidatus Magasanikbacteria bacterium GW2011_GWA2_56_11]|uniref:Non-canonical purine NTP pyrophosphatase n=1 Tax=Candidatus Magasanikbacteria bacterium GW2011_GWA2_56_11 TaxID=1619044 RepID=A0A0G1YGZ4_9BACT|nr:MAG: Non-canonical purine NTP pyrophosphatase [Candidatus Magasanikbacteria bacterium GW2011_GWA2_56_11]